MGHFCSPEKAGIQLWLGSREERTVTFYCDGWQAMGVCEGRGEVPLPRPHVHHDPAAAGLGGRREQ